VQVMEKVVKGAFEDVVSGSKWVLNKMSNYSFDDNVKTSPLTKKEIMSPTDIPCLVRYICTEYDALKGLLVGRKNK
jgi:hypothetical protein